MPCDAGADFIAKYGRDMFEKGLAFLDSVLIDTDRQLDFGRLLTVAPIVGGKLVNASIEELEEWARAVARQRPATLIVDWRPGKRAAERVRLSFAYGVQVDKSMRARLALRAVSTPVETTWEKLPRGA